MANSQLTPYPELDDVLKRYSQKIKDTLKENFNSFYLQGSLAIGDFDLTSDIDFIVITKTELNTDEINLIQKIHLENYHQNNRWVKRFEYSFFPEEKLVNFSSPYIGYKKNNLEDRKLWYFDNGSKVIEKSDHCNTLVTRWTLKEKGIRVLGENIDNFLMPISKDELRKEIKNTMIGWGKEITTAPSYIRNRFYQSYLVLNYSRMLQDLYIGRVTSKLDGVNWAKKNLDPKWILLIEFCWKERQDIFISVEQPYDPEIFSQVLNFVKYTINLAENFLIC